LQKNIIPRLKLRRLPSRIAWKKISRAACATCYKLYVLSLARIRLNSDEKKNVVGVRPSEWGRYKGRNLSSSQANFFASAHRKRDACDAMLTIRAQEFKEIKAKNCLILDLLIKFW